MLKLFFQLILLFWALTFTPFYSLAQTPLSFFEDAAIRAIQFVDGKEGWAVGDEGVIWHTINGGKDWERQPTGTRASLKSLNFLSPYLGWAVGTEYHPTLESVGVILFTKDGGLKWTKVLHNSLPGLNYVKFSDTQNGILAGYSTDAYPAGFFFTTDGGKSWKKGEGPKNGTWYTASLTGKGSGFLAGSHNSIANLANFKSLIIENAELSNRSFKSSHNNLKTIFLVGQGSQILANDALVGNSWTSLNTGLSTELASCIDFNAIHGIGDHLWVAGKPGSVLFHSKDEGKKWNIIKTNNNATLNAIFFIDKMNGWTAGEFGTILATTDGGNTWVTQKRGASQAKILVIQTGLKDVSPEISAYLGLDKKNIVSNLNITSVLNPNNHTHPPQEDSLVFHLRKAGAATVENYWQFPISHIESNDTPQKILENWDRYNNNKAGDQLLRMLTLSIRSAKPDLIVLCSQEQTQKEALYQVLKHATIQANDMANTATSFEEQISTLSLAPWKAKQIIHQEFQGKSLCNLNLSEPLASLESNLMDFADPLRFSLRIDANTNTMVNFSPASPKETPRNYSQDFEEGLTGINKRIEGTISELTKEKLASIRSSTLLRKISQSPLDPNSDPSILLSKMQAMVAGLEDEQAARLLSNIGILFFKNGQWSASREIFKLITTNYPASQAAADATKWLIFHDSSTETRRRHELGQFISLIKHEFGKPGAETLKPAIFVDKFSVPDTAPASQPGNIKKTNDSKKITVKIPEVPVIKPSHSGEVQTLNNPAEAKAWFEYSLSLENTLAAFGPLASKDPRLFFSAQASRRNLGKIEDAKAGLEEFVGTAPAGPWKQNALAELWIMERRGNPPKEVFTCKLTNSKPILDGKLNDDCWKTTKAVKLVDWSGISSKENYTEFKTLYDSEFLYVSAICTSKNTITTKSKISPTRDLPLKSKDLIFFQIDLDRDYTTCYQFQIDSLGNVIDDCWGDLSWNPKWFFATENTDTGWTFEAAIPMGMISSSPPTSGKSWAINFGRMIQNQGVQTWSSPAKMPDSNESLEGMGLMFFLNQDANSTPGSGKPTGITNP